MDIYFKGTHRIFGTPCVDAQSVAWKRCKESRLLNVLAIPWYSESLFVCYRVMCVLFEKMVRVFCSVLVLLEVFLQQNQCPSSIHIFNWCWWGLTDRNQLVHQRFTLNSLSTLSVPAQQSVGQICRTSNPSDIACIATQFSGFVIRFVLEAHIITIGIYRTLYLCTAPCPRKIIWSPKCVAFICARTLCFKDAYRWAVVSLRDQLRPWNFYSRLINPPNTNTIIYWMIMRCASRA